jgi:hypothetical protein
MMGDMKRSFVFIAAGAALTLAAAHLAYEYVLLSESVIRTSLF